MQKNGGIDCRSNASATASIDNLIKFIVMPVTETGINHLINCLHASDTDSTTQPQLHFGFVNNHKK